ncbi:FG-GAP-like repeat-containing protein [Streptomyces sp. NPDC059247]|uniref:FG-GAP-like repeat-containing protein n=1 Tax=Streptomyces sp. NPDC059247 TaxID=3346790 RepID=UPI0036A862F3
MTPGTARRTLAAAITTVLAATALATAPAAVATPGEAAGTRTAAVTAAETLPKFPLDTTLTGAGPSGFLGNTTYARDGIWMVGGTWFRRDGGADAVTGPDSSDMALPNALVSDIVAVGKNDGHRVVRLRDMSAPEKPGVVHDLRTLGATHTMVGLYGSTLLVQSGAEPGPKELHLVSKDGSALTARKITGVPADMGSVTGTSGAGGTAVVSYESTGTPGTTGTLTVDLASAKVTATLPDTPVLSATRTVRTDAGGLVVTDRATGAERRIAVDGIGAAKGFFGDFVAYTLRGKHGLFAHSLTDGTTVKVLDKVIDTVPGWGDVLLVRGGSIEHGDGIYRLDMARHGDTSVVKIATTGKETALKLVGTTIGPVVNTDPMNGRYNFSWTLSHSRFDATVRLTHKKTGRVYNHKFEDVYGESVGFLWHGNFYEHSDHPGVPMPNGDYSWELTAKPYDGIGPDVNARGDFKLVRSPKTHDFGSNGTPDLLARDKWGGLRRMDTVYDVSRGRVVEGDSDVSHGWQGYRQLESVGDVAGTNAPDVIGVDGAGALWFHPGTGADQATPLGQRVKIGGGWGIYNQLAGGSDLTGDGRADLVAVDKAGDLYLYKGTGKASAPFAPRKKTGFGWGIYNKITAVGNLAGGPAGDLVARDKNGVLWLYLGKGDGTFATRSRIGAGWNQYTHIVGIGDATMDGRPDVYAIGPYNTIYIHQGSGNWRAPFQERKPTEVFLRWDAREYNKVF